MNKNIKKVVNPMNLVGHVANGKADKVIAAAGITGTIAPSVQLNKVVLREQAFNAPAGKPFYAFAKSAGSLAVLVDVVTGHSLVVDASIVASMSQVTGKFKIDDVIYDKLDDVNGQARYHAVRVSRRTRAKAMNRHKTVSELHTAEQEAFDAYWQAEEPWSNE